MKRSPSCNAFTLIEMITVIAIIAILASLVLSINGLVQRKAATAKAQGEITALSAAITSYKTDYGGYPQDSNTTDKLDPRTNGDPSSSAYKNSTVALYKKLVGDEDLNGVTDDGAKNYMPDFFKPSRIGGTDPLRPTFIKDPFGFSYGYSTAGLSVEQQFQADLQTNSSATRKAAKGYNPTFDLWSTGGSTATTATPDTTKWIKNW